MYSYHVTEKMHVSVVLKHIDSKWACKGEELDIKLRKLPLGALPELQPSRTMPLPVACTFLQQSTINTFSDYSLMDVRTNCGHNFHPIISKDWNSHNHKTFSDNLSISFSVGKWTLLFFPVSLLWGLPYYVSEWVAILSWPHHKKEKGMSALQINKSPGLPWIQGKNWKMSCIFIWLSCPAFNRQILALTQSESVTGLEAI